MKKNLEILDFEDKKTQSGKRYTRFKTSDGWMSCFDSVSNELLKKFEGKTACVEVIESGEFSNIRKCYGAAEEIGEVINVENGNLSVPVVKMSSNSVSINKSATMYVSYAKDVFLGIVKPDLAVDELKNVMKAAVQLVKMAKEAFE